jgi:enoyl-CoA hydratase / 3-hydroxyacyl-CoA dehydrogenase
MIPEIRKICFIGAGTQGCINSLICSAYGYESVLYDQSQTALQQVTERQQAMGRSMIRQGIFDREALEQTLSRVSATTDLMSAVETADLLNESIHENLELKRKVHKELDALCPEKTILTTNTSSLLVSELEDTVERGDRFAALHFNGTFPFIDLVPGSRTSDGTVHILKTFIRSLDMRPMLLKKEKDGYLGNSLFISFLTTALLLVIDGHADLEDVDRTWMMIQNSPSGPFAQMDNVGLNVVLDIIGEQARRSRIDDSHYQKFAAFLNPFIKRGDLGVKTGRGFYQYPKPAYRDSGFLMKE